MQQKITAESFRKKTREDNENFSKVIDKHYNAFFEVAQTMVQMNIKGTRIETPYGDFTIIPNFSLNLE